MDGEIISNANVYWGGVDAEDKFAADKADYKYTYLSFTEWKKLNQDTLSFFADPLIVTTGERIDFQDDSPIYKLGILSFEINGPLPYNTDTKTVNVAVPTD